MRPDGQETFIQQGWLRASHRKLDEARSTELLPYQTHQQADAALLTPGEVVPVRVEVFPFGHLVREGSRIRVWVEAPTFLPQLWAFTPTPVPGAVTVLHDAAHPSRLVLPKVPNDENRLRTLPACGSLIHQPCRQDPLGAVSSAQTPNDATTATIDSTTSTVTQPGAQLPVTGRALPIAPALAALVAAMAILVLHRTASQ